MDILDVGISHIGGSQRRKGSKDCPPGARGSVWRHLRLSYWGEGATGMQWVEARDATHRPTVHRTDLATKKDPVQNVNGADVEKS